MLEYYQQAQSWTVSVFLRLSIINSGKPSPLRQIQELNNACSLPCAIYPGQTLEAIRDDFFLFGCKPMASQVSGGQPVGGESAEQGIVHLPEDAVWETAVPVRGGGGGVF